MNAKPSQRKSQNRSSKNSRNSSSRIKVQKRKNNVRILRPRRKTGLNVGRIVLLGISIAFIAWAIYPITYRIEQGRELGRLKKQLCEIQKENGKLRKNVKRLSSDEYVEQRARSLGLSMADEEIVVVVPEKSRKSLKETGSKTEKEVNEIPPASLWQRVTGVFSQIF